MALEERVKAIMADLFLIDPSEIGSDTSMESQEQWDSLAQIDLIAALEEEFGVMFEVEDFELMTDLSAIMETLAEMI
jgi:acyl carrier protein